MAASGRVANGIGEPVRRKEDFRLLTGQGSFGDDLAPPELVHAVTRFDRFTRPGHEWTCLELDAKLRPPPSSLPDPACRTETPFT